MTTYTIKETKSLPKIIVTGYTIYSVSRNDGKKGKSGLAIVAPEISDSLFTVFLNNEFGSQYLKNCVKELRGEVINQLVVAGQQITDDAIGITALISAAKNKIESVRMTKEVIGRWFDSDLKPLVQEKISDKFANSGGIAEDKMEKILEMYKNKFQILAMREPVMENAVKIQLTKAIALLPNDYDSVIGEKIITALDDVTEASDILEAL